MPGLQRARGRLRPGRRCAPGPSRTATAGASPARRSGRPTPAWRSGACSPPGSGPGERHEGITMFLVPMDTPGITVRPIRSHARPPPPQRGVLRRGVGRPRRRARRRSARAGPSSARRWPTSGSASPATPAASGSCPPSARSWRRTGTSCPRRCTPSGRGRSCRCAWPACSPTARCTPRRPASCPTCWPRAARIAVTQCDQAVAEVLFQAVEHEAPRGRAPARRCTAPSRTTGATPRRPPWPRAPSRCSA